MLLKELASGDLVEILDLTALCNPFAESVLAQFQHGEDLAEPEPLAKKTLRFPSGEALPRCWLDGSYRDSEVGRRLPW